VHRDDADVQVRRSVYLTSGGNTIMRASNDADSTAELEIQLAGLVTPTVDDFYL
jgi:hypothetical protein